MTEYSTRELHTMIASLEKSVDRLEAMSTSREAMDAFKYQLGQKATRESVDAIKEDVSALQEANIWQTRAVIGAMITAVVGSIISAIIGVIIRLPPM